MDNLERWQLIVYNDNIHTVTHFVKSISTVIPKISKNLISKYCLLIHEHGSASVYIDSLEHIEHYKNRLDRFGLKTSIEAIP